MATVLVTIIFPGLLALAAGWDLASYTIPNRLSLVLVAAFLVFAAVFGLPITAIGSHLATATLALVLGFALFAAGFVGGGDAKLFAATALWFGFSDFASYALIAALFGGALTLAILMARRLPLPSACANQQWLLRLHDSRSGIPYGVALAAGALFVLPHTEIFRLATHA